ncbi:Conserved_hypothetical protein [Hexamita inflata]|uniref:Uncharacterized protein n=1 Tax=Hexamita inflata TaxID=28002 RepID=A0AA86RFK3_9EUKA|nr:Conserved hypothetical protein [Hexamita inflata]
MSDFNKQQEFITPKLQKIFQSTAEAYFPPQQQTIVKTHLKEVSTVESLPRVKSQVIIQKLFKENVSFDHEPPTLQQIKDPSFKRVNLQGELLQKTMGLKWQAAPERDECLEKFIEDTTCKLKKEKQKLQNTKLFEYIINTLSKYEEKQLQILEEIVMCTCEKRKLELNKLFEQERQKIYFEIKIFIQDAQNQRVDTLKQYLYKQLQRDQYRRKSRLAIEQVEDSIQQIEKLFQSLGEKYVQYLTVSTNVQTSFFTLTSISYDQLLKNTSLNYNFDDIDLEYLNQSDQKTALIEYQMNSSKISKYLQELLTEQAKFENPYISYIQTALSIEYLVQESIKKINNNFKIVQNIIGFANIMRNIIIIKILDENTIFQTIQNNISKVIKLSNDNIQTIQTILQQIQGRDDYDNLQIEQVKQLLLKEQQEQLRIQNINRVDDAIALIKQFPSRLIKIQIEEILQTEFSKLSRLSYQEEIQVTLQPIRRMSFVEHPDHQKYCQQQFLILREIQLVDNNKKLCQLTEDLQILKSQYKQQLQLFLQRQLIVLLDGISDTQKSQVEQLLKQVQQIFLSWFNNQEIDKNSWLDYKIICYEKQVSFAHFDSRQLRNTYNKFVIQAIQYIEKLHQEQVNYQNPLADKLLNIIEIEQQLQQILMSQMSKQAQIAVLKCIQDLRTQICIFQMDGKNLTKSYELTQAILLQQARKTYDQLYVMIDKVGNQNREQIIQQLQQYLMIEDQMIKQTPDIELSSAPKILEEYLKERFARLQQARVLCE